MSNLAAALSLLSPARRNRGMSWQAYSLVYLPLAASAVNTKATVTTQDNSSFLAMRVKAYVTDTAAPPAEVATPQATVTFQVGSTLIFPDGNPVHISNFITNANDHRGHELEFPFLLPPATIWQAFASNLTATAMSLRIVFWGLAISDIAKPANGL